MPAPFVMRLACADTPEIEKQRADYILRHTCGYFILPFDVGLQALERARAIGRQADPLAPEEVQTWMDAAREGRSTPASPIKAALVPDTLFLSKVKSWLTMRDTDPAT